MRTNPLAKALADRAAAGSRGTAAGRLLGSGQGWRAFDIVCTSGPQDRPFEERLSFASIALVLAGTFRYRSPHGTALLAPGQILLGESDQCFECGHEHGRGDRCIAFHFEPAFFETIAAAVPGVRTQKFGTSVIPPLASLSDVLADVELAAHADQPESVEEIALRLAGSVLRLVSDTARQRPPSALDRRRISHVVRHIEARSDCNSTIAELSRLVDMSPYHFLRVFRAVVGATPHQYLVRTRLRKAAIQLRRTPNSIASIAFDSGFGDLSTFNRTFRAAFGRPPGQFRQRGSPALRD